jgi:hypothetical protein
MRFLTKTNRLLLLLVATLALHSCGVKQPDPSFLVIKTGNIFISSNPDNAVISLNNIRQSVTTPDTLKNIPLGQYVVKVFKDGYTTDQDSIVVNVEENVTRSIHFSLLEIIVTGQVIINSEPSGAEIFLDGLSSGKLTPDTLITSPGEHVIGLQKNGYIYSEYPTTVIKDNEVVLNEILEIQPVVLLEAFGSVNCAPCAEATEALHEFSNANNENTFVILEYFVKWSGNDPFYSDTEEDSDTRTEFYTGNPWPFFIPFLKANGVDVDDPKDVTSIQSEYQNRIDAHQLKPAISISKGFENDVLEVVIEVANSSDENFSANLNLFVGIIENDIQFAEAPGSNGVSHFDYVFRGFVTTVNGVALPSDQNGFTWQGSMNWGDWVYQNSRVIAFVQNMNTKHVLNATIN